MIIQIIFTSPESRLAIAGVALGAARQWQSEGQRAQQQTRVRDLPHKVTTTSLCILFVCLFVCAFLLYKLVSQIYLTRWPPLLCAFGFIVVVLAIIFTDFCRPLLHLSLVISQRCNLVYHGSVCPEESAANPTQLGSVTVPPLVTSLFKACFAKRPIQLVHSRTTVARLLSMSRHWATHQLKLTTLDLDKCCSKMSSCQIAATETRSTTAACLDDANSQLCLQNQWGKCTIKLLKPIKLWELNCSRCTQHTYR